MLRRTLLAVVLGSAASVALSQPADEPKTDKTAEPEVRRIVVEDDNARIDELRVRGLTKRITVHPKHFGGAYEIQPNDPIHAPANTADGTRNSGGQRVWNVLAF